jgi:hypothetical protein
MTRGGFPMYIFEDAVDSPSIAWVLDCDYCEYLMGECMWLMKLQPGVRV